LTIAARPRDGDPLSGHLRSGTAVGMIGIQFATRRRNRMNGIVAEAGADGLTLHTTQAFGNCPQYIQERVWRRAEAAAEPSRRDDRLDEGQAALIAAADTFFIGSGTETDIEAGGMDASHRAGAPGFVEIVDDRTLRFPDYAGNNYFNTIGNLLRDPRCGLLFADFASGRLLHLTGRAQVEWAPDTTRFPGARRLITVAIDEVIDRPAATALRWRPAEDDRRELELVRRVRESDDTVSFYFVATDDRPLARFEAGQHLPIEIEDAATGETLKRTYSLSNAPGDPHYRISVKRAENGRVSNLLHDGLHPSDRIAARDPAGDFMISCDRCSVVLVSAGIGITPMLSMFHALAAEPARRRVWFLHGTQNRDTHALGKEVTEIAASWPETKVLTFYSDPGARDREGTDYTAKGRITPDDLARLYLPSDAHVFMCGPPAFMRSMMEAFTTLGLPATQIHFEDFGPAG
ncbi:MAG: pyridoxamine 5'-phosphate oxidase family protein, partial [Pseudomonadota bacterium]